MDRMLANWKWRKILPSAGLAALAGLAASDASATDRTVYFVATGTNRTTVGLTSAAASSCRIVISNPSSQPQTFDLTTTIQSIDAWVGNGSVTGSLTSTTPGGLGCTVSSCSSVPVAANGSVTLVYSFTAFPLRTATGQGLRCSGSIVAHDSGGQPGFLLASGVLVTFTESASMHTDATTGGAARTFGGIPVYSQVPVVINRGKPF